MFVIEVFNSVYFFSWLVCAGLFAAGTVLARKKGRQFGEKFLSIFMLLMFVYFFLYKYGLINDTDYQLARAAAGLEGSYLLNELPLQLCNINLFIIPLGILLKKENIKAFSFFTAPIGALLALLMPSVGLSGASIFTPRIFGYFSTHFVVFFGGLSLFSFGIYKPEYKEIPRAILTLLCIAFLVFLVNVLMVKTGINTSANYMFTMRSEGNSLLEILYKKIKLPFVSVLPVLLVFVPYMYGITALVKKFSFKQK